MNKTNNNILLCLALIIPIQAWSENLNYEIDYIELNRQAVTRNYNPKYDTTLPKQDLNYYQSIEPGINYQAKNQNIQAPTNENMAIYKQYTAKAEQIQKEIDSAKDMYDLFALRGKLKDANQRAQDALSLANGQPIVRQVNQIANSPKNCTTINHGTILTTRCN